MGRAVCAHLLLFLSELSVNYSCCHQSPLSSDSNLFSHPCGPNSSDSPLGCVQKAEYRLGAWVRHG